MQGTHQKSHETESENISEGEQLIVCADFKKCEFYDKLLQVE